MLKKGFKIFGWIVLVLLIVAQFFQPDANASPAYSGHRMTDRYKVPEEVSDMLSVSCYDCHSNNSRPMFYMHMQPLGWWISHHIEEGKNELNFDEFGTYPLNVQYHKLEEIVEVIDEDEMPLTSYTIIHTDAKLSPVQKEAITAWATALMDTLEANYPKDSLESRR
jgi:hypothetical protein